MTEANDKDYRVGNDGFWARAWVTPLVLAVVGGLVLVAVAFDLPAVVSGHNPYNPATFEFSHLSIPQLLTLWASLGWFVLELGTMLTNRRRRALHDLIASSVVMRVDLWKTENAREDGGV